MSRTIVYILGTSFSGSSLLNSLLDAQPATRGLGEAVHLVDKPSNAWCSRCRCHVSECRLQAAVEPSNFYSAVFRYYGDARVLANSSKHWGLCFRHMPHPPPEYRMRLIVLSKSLEEFAYSYVMHNGCGWNEAFAKWTEFYARLFFHLDCVLNDAPQLDTHHQLVSRLRRDDVGYVTYKELSMRPEATLQQLCGKLDLPFNAGFRSRLWQSDSCVIGGNNAIYAQQTGNTAFFESNPTYLGGKYNGRHRNVFYDDAWASNEELSTAAVAFRAAAGATVEHLEKRLGHVSAVESTR